MHCMVKEEEASVALCREFPRISWWRSLGVFWFSCCSREKKRGHILAKSKKQEEDRDDDYCRRDSTRLGSGRIGRGRLKCARGCASAAAVALLANKIPRRGAVVDDDGDGLGGSVTGIQFASLDSYVDVYV